jgi:hypothetical protein
MGKITAGLFMALDGVVEAPGTSGTSRISTTRWVPPWMPSSVRPTPSCSGRKTYDSFAGAWPVREAAGGVDAPFAKVLGDARKIVVSSRPLEVTWRNSEQLHGDFVEAGRRAAERTW